MKPSTANFVQSVQPLMAEVHLDIEDPPFFQAYFSAASDLHNTQVKTLLSTHLELVKKATEEEIEQGKSQFTTNRRFV